MKILSMSRTEIHKCGCEYTKSTLCGTIVEYCKKHKKLLK